MQTEEPFESAFLHPKGSAGKLSGNEVEACADADTAWNAHLTMVHVNPLLLLGGAECDEKDIGPRFLHTGGDGIAVELKELRVRGGVEPADLKAGVLALEPFLRDL